MAMEMPAISVLMPAASARANLRVLEVDVVDDLADRAAAPARSRPISREQHLESAAVAVVGELGLEHVEAQLAGSGR